MHGQRCVSHGAGEMRRRVCQEKRTGVRDAQSQNSFEMMSRSKRKKGNNIWSVSLVLYVIFLCLSNGRVSAEDRVASDNIALFVDENQPPGTFVGTVADPADSRIINSYVFLSSSPPQEFHLNRTSGVITTTVRIDRESLSSDLFQLPVTKTFQSGASNVVELSITVNDLNDNTPVFPQPTITVVFSENAHIGSVQILPSAMDIDKNVNGYVSSYSIESGNEDDIFSLETFRPREDAEYTVSLTTRKYLDREAVDFYILNISATDNSSNPRTGYLTVNVTIDDVNDNAPSFSQTSYSARVNESAATGALVVRLEATDLDQGSNGEVVYGFKDGIRSEQFSVDPDTGWISLLQSLPYTDQGYNLEVVATDRGVPPQSSIAFVSIQVEDENDHSPEIHVIHPAEADVNGTVQIPEAARPNDFVFSLQGTDQDSGVNGQVSLSLFSGNERGDFRLLIFGGNFGTILVAINGTIDREIMASYNLTFMAADLGTPQQISYRSIIVLVVDENDHTPVFLQESYSAQLNESVQVGSFVESVTAYDADEGINAVITYSISGDEFGWFSIDHNTGLVTTKAELDHETSAQVILTITASDQGTEQLSNVTTLVIDILDDNDEYPLFDQNIYNATVPENLAPVDLFQATATDMDGGVYGSITYSLGVTQHADKFSIDPSSGMLSTVLQLDREEMDFYEFEILAHDGGYPPLVSTSTVRVQVSDVNDNNPVFYPVDYFASVVENEAAGAVITTVTASDEDIGVNADITYTISNSSRFGINSSSGVVSTLEVLDREERSSYTLAVTATDGGGLISQPATIHITVTDTQDNPLHFEQNPYRFQLQENNPNITDVGTVKATSLDLNVNIAYVITGGDPDSFFRINPNSGMLTTRQSIDRESQASDLFQLTVRAIAGSQNGETTVEIEILDINDNAPQFAVSQDQVDIVENWEIGYEFYSARVTDSDSPPNNLILYDLSVNVDNRFGINHTSGVLYINKDLQVYDEKEYTLEIQATDYGTPPLSSTLALLVNVRDVNNNAPIFVDSFNTSLKLVESVQVNTRFVQVTATDADQGTNGHITYRITDGNDADNFGVFPDGFLYVKSALDRELISSYVLTIEAIDGGVPPLSSTIFLEIEILDENDNRPLFESAVYNFYLLEEEEAGVEVGTIQAIDPDIGRNGELSYSFTSNNSYFALNSMSGVITSRVRLDRESLVQERRPTTFTARVRVRDNGMDSLQDHADVNIHIVDSNDNAPVFNRQFYQASVSELAQNQTLIIRVSATDDDSGDNSYIIYSIVNGNEERKFYIDHVTGQIILIAGLDREDADGYLLTVKARDGGAVPQEALVDVEITVLDENDHAPTFQNLPVEIEVTECLQIGDTIGLLNATDMDINSNGMVSYTITGGNQDGVFGITPGTGVVYLTGLLDHEATSSYNLDIAARDGGSPPLNSVVSVVINVRDCNDNAPVFAYVGVPEISEEESIGYQVVRVQATDSDSGVNGMILYSILSQQPSGDFFAIDPNSGWLSTNKRIDRESTTTATDQFTLVILATDQAVPEESRRATSVEVVIFVRDINDNAPTFTSQQAVILPRNTSPNSKIATIHADDPDAGVNGQVTYTLVTTSVPFQLNLNTGELTLTQAVRSSVNLYSLVIQAQDAGNNPQQQTSTFTLTVIVSDGQPSALTFSQNSYSERVSENQPAGTAVQTVFASYPDGRLANIEYYVTSVQAGGVDQGNLIVADPSNGIIQTGAILDRENLEGGSLLVATVYAVDTSSSSSQVTSAQITITVIDENDNAPIFNEAPYNVSITENSPTNSLVTTVTATDADIGSHSIISYNITAGASNLFSLDATNGEIRTKGVVNRESSALYQLLILASDGTQSSTATVNIHVLDENDNDPEFSTSAYSFLVPEDAMVGEDVGVVVATDPDAGPNGEVVYSVVAEGAPGEDVFFLDPSTGSIRLLQTLDYESKQHYFLNIMASDNGNPPRSSTTSVYINVDDVNDNDPVFDPTFYSEEVPENVAVGTSVATLSATDLDSGVNGELEFIIASGDPSARFVVYDNGTVATAKALDRESESFYNLQVMAVDKTPDQASRRSSTAQVSIIVTDINDNAPRFMNQDTVSVAENTRTNVIILALYADDDDVERNSYVEYSLLTPSVPFAVSTVEGNLRVTGPLDRETAPSYNLLVQATDKGNPPQSSVMNITVHITDVNDNAPTFDPQSYHATLDEDTPVGLEFVRVAATDPDEGLNAIVRYSILSGDVNDDFALDEVTGVISVNSALDYERQSSYSLIIRAQDQGYSTQVSSVTVTINIVDINDNSPIFVDSYTPSIMENNLPSYDVVQVSTSDADSGSNGIVSYRLLADYDGLFTIGSTSGLIEVTDVLDYEAETEYELIVIAQDAGTPSHQATSIVVLTVEDDNDHDPVFASDMYRATISEDASPDTFVVQVTATDVDATSDLRYQLNDDIGSKFTIDPLGGRIITSGVLDRETQTSYVLTVTVHDGPSRQAQTTVVVEVLDVNDNAPHFPSSSYLAVIPATSPQGRYVAAVQADDLDLGANAVITYSLTGSGSSKFQIDANTGVVFTAEDLTNEMTTYEMQITAQNTAPGQNPAVAQLRVEFSTASFPVITAPSSGSSHSFSENTQIGFDVVTVTATSGTTFSIAGGNHGDTFEVDSQSGLLTLAQNLDYEMFPSYSLWLEAADGSNPPLSDFVEVRISVTDENDNAPVFDQLVYTATVVEEQAIQVDVVTVSAQDKDSGVNGQVTYSIESGNTNDAFTIDPSSGLLRTSGALDRERTPEYLLTVVASDGTNPAMSGSAIVVITVADINDNRMSFTRIYEASIPENAPPGTHVVTVHTTDPDESNLSQFALEAGGSSSLFAIDEVTGEITVNGTLDFENEKEQIHYLLVKAQDGIHNVQTQVTVNVEDVNDNAPVFTTDFIELTFPEFVFSSNVPLTTLSATDSDDGDNGQIDFILKTMTDMFRVESTAVGGWVYPTQPISYIVPQPGQTPDPNRYEFSVFAVDGGTPSLYDEASIVVHVIQDNSYKPVFDPPTYFSPVTEDMGSNERIIQVTATDRDSGSNAVIVYSVTGGNGTSRFGIESNTGWVTTLTTSLMGDIGSIYQLQIKAIDQGHFSKEDNTTVTLLITGSNNFAPVFDYQTFPASVSENVVGAEIITVHAMDDDNGINGEIRYSLTAADDDLFSVDETSGLITVIGSLDREVSQQHQVKVVAQDSALYSRSATATVVITVTDVDDNAPQFNPSEYVTDVYENSPSATPVITVTATDADVGANADFEYIITGGDTDFFTINRNSGLILTQGNLDYEAGKVSYQLTVAATNEEATMVSSAHVTVNLLGMNEYYPVFSQHQYEFYVNEHAADGTPVGMVFASDNDIGNDAIVYYLLIGGSNSQGFTINSDTGLITVSFASGMLDREEADTVTLSVMAKNEGPIFGNDIDEAEVVIHIQDGNDAPVFTSDQYQARVSEDAPRGSYITIVTAVDYDEEPSFRQFNYSIIDGNTDDAFSVDARTGRIQTAAALDRETVAIYYLTLAAVDSGSPQQTGTTSVIVQLDDVNDNGPSFVGDAAQGFVFENEPSNELVMTLSATDPDLSSDPSRFTYTLLPTADSPAFTLSGNVLRTTQTLDREIKSDYFLQIQASDGESPAVTAVSAVHITVADRNDNPSSARQAGIEVKMYQSRFNGGLIGSVKPIDPDSDDIFTCQITSGDTSQFSIQSNCNLFSNQRTGESQLSLHVSGNDGSHQSVTSSFTVIYESFTNDTLSNSVTLRLADTTAERFLSQSYDLFKTSLSTFLSSQEDVIVLSITDSPGIDKVNMLLAVKKQNGQHLLREELVQVLTSNEATLENQAKMIIESIDYTACSDDPCQNNGICSYYIDHDLQNVIVESNPVIFVGIQTTHGFTCSCPAEYGGKTCEIPTDYCEDANCLNGATCQNDIGGYTCACLPGFTGARCESEVNECSSAPCINGGTCEDLTNGFYCDCADGYTGFFCEIGPCSVGPCENGGTCTEGEGTFVCQCDDSHWGERCQHTTIGFEGGSFIAFPSLPSSSAVVSIEFAMTSTHGLLLYNHDDSTSNNAIFVALEVVEGLLQLSFNFAPDGQSSISTSKVVNDGNWHKVEVRLEGASVSLNLLDDDCRTLSSDACSAVQMTTISLDFGGTPLSIGGVADITEITSRPSQVSSADFVGCMKGIYINGQRKDMTNAVDSAGLVEGCSREGGTCSSAQPCPDGNTCVEEWWDSWCQCDPIMCSDVYQPVTLGDGGFVTYRIKEDYKRQQLLEEAKSLSRRRRRRAAASESVGLSFRTDTKDALLLYITSDEEFTALQLKDGLLEYSHGSSGQSSGELLLDAPSLGDGAWHSISLSLAGDLITLVVDNIEKTATFADPHEFTALAVTGMWIGGAETPIVINGQAAAGFTGCLDDVEMNGKPLPLDGETERFEAVPSGSAGEGCDAAGPCLGTPCGQGEVCVPDGDLPTCVPTACASDTCRNGGTCSESGGRASCTCLDGFAGSFCETESEPTKNNNSNVLYIVLPIIFVILLIVVIVVAVLYVRRRSFALKKRHAAQNNALGGVPKTLGLSPTDNPGFMGDTFDDATMIGSDGKVNVSGLIQRQTPDIIEQNMAIQNNSNPSSNSLMMENDTGEHVNIEMDVRNGPEFDEAEHYDLENASSLAASDIDVAYHYKHYHDRDRNRRKKKHRPSQNPLLARIQASPARLSPVSNSSHHMGNDIAHSTPLDAQNAILRQSPGLHSNYSTNNTLRIGSVPNSGRATPARSLASPVNSEHSYQSELRSQAHRSDVSSIRSGSKARRGATPLSHEGEKAPSKGRTSKSPLVGLTAEEVAQLNTARPDLMSGSHASTIDDLSSVSSGGHPCRHRRDDHTPVDPSHLLEPPDSTSDDTNDSFTCSEMESEYGKRRFEREFSAEAVIRSKLAEIEDAEDSVLPHVNGALKQRRLDSRGGSLITSEEENGHPRKDKSNPEVSLERLLGWGPRFEHLVGVFKDIAQLHENNGKITLQTSLTHEEFV
ncbi:protocadherin Fat 4-like [Diadema antillarum]|uniref:protocadherin Fat 4-like n=1 Tax=Diadema antillarum TaxID=105358 RepID=UPI003A8ADD94